MRLRRETGDYDIVIANNAATISKNLTCENLIGNLIVDGTAIYVINSAVKDSTTIALGTANTGYTYTYTIATGGVAKAQVEQAASPAAEPSGT